jgi:hypothetical protein
MSSGDELTKRQRRRKRGNDRLALETPSARTGQDYLKADPSRSKETLFHGTDRLVHLECRIRAFCLDSLIGPIEELLDFR